MDELSRGCPNCGEEIDLEGDFCPNCGHLLNAAGLARCTNHPDVFAEAVCVLCSEAYCAECIMPIGGRYLCEKHAHVEIKEGWANVYESEDTFQASLAKSVLETMHVELMTENESSIGFKGMGISDNAFGRSVSGQPVKIFVRIYDYGKARRFLEDWSRAKKKE